MPGERWYDNTRVIWSLFAVVGILLGIIGSMVWARVLVHDEAITTLRGYAGKSEVQYSEVIRRLDRIEKKLDDK